MRARADVRVRAGPAEVKALRSRTVGLCFPTLLNCAKKIHSRHFRLYRYEMNAAVSTTILPKSKLPQKYFAI
jgi:hypothetical protein